MKKGITWIILICLMVASLVLASCSKSTTTSTSTSTSIPTTKTTTTNTVTTSAPLTTNTTTTAATGNWWDSLGTPQYGGNITLQVFRDFVSFDPYAGEGFMDIVFGYMEQLFTTDWTMDPAVQPYQMSFWSNDQAAGGLLQSWEFTSPGTFVLHLRQGIHWQNIAPANGREFVAADVVYHFNRLFGLGGGFTKPGQYWGTVGTWTSLQSVIATDKYTVVMQWNTPNPEFVTENLEAPGVSTSIENPEAVQQWGNLDDWHHAIGTGPFILTDFVSGSSATLIKNPNYWGYDERHPQNQLPYVDKISYLVIPDPATSLAGMRTGKIDILDNVSVQNAQAVQKTNPEILRLVIPSSIGFTIDVRNDKVPFNDIRVREALQMAIDLPTIAKTYYGGIVDPSPLTLSSNYLTGWGFPYNQWPQDLKDQYAYNPTAAKQLLTAAGYPNGFKTDVVADSSADMNLMQIVKSYFANVGVDMDIRPIDSAAWIAFVLTGHKQDALSFRITGSLGLSFYPLRQLTKFRTGNSSNVGMVSDPVFDAFYTKAMAVTSTDQLKTIMTDANKYVTQQHFTISLLQPTGYSLCQPWLMGFNCQYGATVGSAGPFLLWFYEARFWIDQSMKNSMGH